MRNLSQPLQTRDSPLKVCYLWKILMIFIDFSTKRELCHFSPMVLRLLFLLSKDVLLQSIWTSHRICRRRNTPSNVIGLIIMMLKSYEWFKSERRRWNGVYLSCQRISFPSHSQHLCHRRIRCNGQHLGSVQPQETCSAPQVCIEKYFTFISRIKDI